MRSLLCMTGLAIAMTLSVIPWVSEADILLTNNTDNDLTALCTDGDQTDIHDTLPANGGYLHIDVSTQQCDLWSDQSQFSLSLSKSSSDYDLALDQINGLVVYKGLTPYHSYDVIVHIPVVADDSDSIELVLNDPDD